MPPQPAPTSVPPSPEAYRGYSAVPPPSPDRQSDGARACLGPDSEGQTAGSPSPPPQEGVRPVAAETTPVIEAALARIVETFGGITQQMGNQQSSQQRSSIIGLKYQADLPVIQDTDPDYAAHRIHVEQILDGQIGTKGKARTVEKILLWKMSLAEQSARRFVYQTIVDAATEDGRLANDAEAVWAELDAALEGTFKETPDQRKSRAEGDYKALVMGDMNYVWYKAKWEEALRQRKRAGVILEVEKYKRDFLNKMNLQLKMHVESRAWPIDGKGKPDREPETWEEVAKAVDLALQKRSDLAWHQTEAFQRGDCSVPGRGTVFDGLCSLQNVPAAQGENLSPICQAATPERRALPAPGPGDLPSPGSPAPTLSLPPTMRVLPPTQPVLGAQPAYFPPPVAPAPYALPGWGLPDRYGTHMMPGAWLPTLPAPAGNLLKKERCSVEV